MGKRSSSAELGLGVSGKDVFECPHFERHEGVFFYQKRRGLEDAAIKIEGNREEVRCTPDRKIQRPGPSELFKRGFYLKEESKARNEKSDRISLQGGIGAKEWGSELARGRKSVVVLIGGALNPTRFQKGGDREATGRGLVVSWGKK